MKTRLILMLATGSLFACTQQNWYQSAQSAQTAHCMKQPLSDYENCNQPANESYNDFTKNKEQLNRNQLEK